MNPSGHGHYKQALGRVRQYSVHNKFVNIHRNSWFKPIKLPEEKNISLRFESYNSYSGTN